MKSVKIIPLLTPDGEVGGRLCFRSHDPEMKRRATIAWKRLNGLFEPIRTVRLTTEGRGVDAASEAVIRKIEKQLTDVVDFVCGVKASQAAFERYAPFASISDDDFWASVVIAALREVVSSMTNNRI